MIPSLSKKSFFLKKFGSIWKVAGGQGIVCECSFGTETYQHCCVREEEPRQWLKPELQVRRGDCGSVGRFKGGACVMCEFNSSRVIAYECNRLSVVGLVV
jgi:hypothetical protein